MNNRIKQLAEQSYEATTVTTIDPVTQEVAVDFIDGTKPFFNQEKFAESLLRNLSEELYDVDKRNKKANKEWADGVNHAAMLAQRMTMNLPQWPEAE